MFLVGVGARELTSEERMAMEHYSFGGFILFGHNCCDPAQILSLTRALWDTRKGLPPFIAIDQEGEEFIGCPSRSPTFLPQRVSVKPATPSSPTEPRAQPLKNSPRWESISISRRCWMSTRIRKSCNR